MNFNLLEQLGLAAIACLAVEALPASAHHSYAMFDRNRTVTLHGIVKLWEYDNPHSLLWIYVNDANNKPVLWGLESVSTAALQRLGMHKNTVLPADKVTVIINPLRDGRNGGNLVEIALTSGKVFNIGHLPPALNLNNGPGSPGNEPRAAENP